MNIKVFDASLEGIKRFKTLHCTVSIKTYIVIVLVTSSLDHWVTVDQTFLSILHVADVPHMS